MEQVTHDLIQSLSGVGKQICLKKRKVGPNLQHLVDIAGTEDLVDVGELVRLVGREVRGEHTVLRAPPPQQLARRARRRHPLLPPCAVLLHPLSSFPGLEAEC